MRGLTDEERATLLRWERREYNYHVYSQRGAPPDKEIFRRLFDRGLAEWETDPEALQQNAVVTALGMAALRIDAAARTAGVWPP